MATPKTTYRSRPDPYLDSGRLHAVQIMLCSRLDELLSELGVRLYKSHRYYHGCCPIHGGNNQSALNLYRTGDVRPGFWACNTKHCEKTFKRTIIGFVRGVLSHQRFNWTHLDDAKQRDAQQIVSWRETVDWCCQFLGQPLKDIEVDYDELEKVQFAAGLSVLTRKPEQEKKGVKRQQVRKHLMIPATYFVKRGFSPEILDRYDVGLYPAPGKPLSNRVAVPVYDDDHDVAIGFTARSVWEMCPKCQRWHNPEATCPDTELAIALASKWWNQGFKKENYLYNFWLAKRAIRESGCVILCEGPGDIWKLEQAGIHCGLAMFGVKLSDQQQVILERSGAMNVIVVTDSDQAGQDAQQDIKRRLNRMFRLHFPSLLKSKDVGEMEVEQIKAVFGPVLQAIKERGY